jgi:hypothetical protein
MPHGVVKTERDERLWEKAKGRVREQYPDVAEDSDRFWRLVMGIFKRMTGRKGVLVSFKATHPEKRPRRATTAHTKTGKPVHRRATTATQHVGEGRPRRRKFSPQEDLEGILDKYRPVQPGEIWEKFQSRLREAQDRIKYGVAEYVRWGTSHLTPHNRDTEDGQACIRAATHILREAKATPGFYLTWLLGPNPEQAMLIPESIQAHPVTQWLEQQGIGIAVGDTELIGHEIIQLRLPAIRELERVKQSFEAIQSCLSAMPTEGKPAPLRIGFHGRVWVRPGTWGVYASHKNLLVVSSKMTESLVHEYGHYLDMQGIIDAGVPQAVLHSVPDADYDRWLQDMSPADEEYWLSPREVWARVFEQYIAERGDPENPTVQWLRDIIQTRIQRYLSPEGQAAVFPVVEAALKQAGLLKALLAVFGGRIGKATSGTHPEKRPRRGGPARTAAGGTVVRRPTTATVHVGNEQLGPSEEHPPKKQRSARYTRKVQREHSTVYEYPEEHTRRAQRAKFERVNQLAEQLPRIVRDVTRALKLPDTPRNKVVAAIVALIDRCQFRIGTEAYAAEHETYGVTTLRVEHVEVHGDEVRFRFAGKKGVPWDRTVTDRRLARFIRQLAANSPDGHLFWYQTDGQQVPITGREVNAWLRRYGITAKDFRTYHATRLAYEGLKAASRPARSKPLTKREARARVAAVVEDVAAKMGHTAAVCRRAYILPALIEDYLRNGGRLSGRAWRPQ